MKSNLTTFAEKLVNGKWMLKPMVHTEMCKLVDAYLKNPVQLSANDSQPAYMSDDPNGSIDSGLHGIINVSGVLSKGVSEVEEQLLGLVDVDWVRSMVDMLAEDPTVKDIIISWGSPGGETTGIEELGRRIQEIDKNIKPVYSWCEKQADSAAFWLYSCGRMCGITPSAQIGSCGVYMLILDETKKMEKEGVSVEAIYSGKYKMMGHPFRQLTDEERAILQKDVDAQHEQFKSTVSSNRPKANWDDFEALSYNGKQALEKGFVDYVVDDISKFIGIIDSSTNANNIYNNNSMKPTVEKVQAVATSVTPEVKAETPSVEATTVATPTKKMSFFDALKQLMGSYDGAYQEVPGVPGTTDAKADDSDTDKSPDTDTDECACSQCNGTGKMKKAKADDAPVETKAEDPAPDDTKKEGSYDGGYQKNATMPTIEEFRSMLGVAHTVKKSEAMTAWEKACGETFTGKIFETK